MKKGIKKLFVFLLAAVFLGKSLYGDIQYARADEYSGPEIAVTEEGAEGEISEDVSGDNVSVDEPSEDVSGDDFPGDDVSDNDVSGDDIVDDPVPGVDTPDDPEPSESGNDIIGPIEPDGTTYTQFYALRRGVLEYISPEVTGEYAIANPDEYYYEFLTFKDGSEYSLDYIISHYNEIDRDIFAEELTTAGTNIVLPEGYESYRSFSETFGINKAYGEEGREYLVENIVGQTEYINSAFTCFDEMRDDGAATGNLIYVTGDNVDWYVTKDADTNLWHTDGYMIKGKVILATKNIPTGVPATYTYNGTSRVSDEAKLIKSTLDKAGASLPGTFVILDVVYVNASGNAVSAITNAGKYNAVATVQYVYQKEDDDFTYDSAIFEVVFPITVNKRTVTVTALNGSKFEGQPDPTLTGRVEGAVSSDPVTAYFWRISGNEAVGRYPIYSTVIASSNYTVVSHDAEFIIYAVVNPEPVPPTPLPPNPVPETPEIVVPDVPEVPEEVVEEVMELEDEDTPLAEAPDEISLGGDTLDVGDVYPQLRDVDIEDDDTPLAAFDDGCWIHWLVVLLTVLDVLYTVILAFRNGAVIKKLKQEKE